MEAPLVLIVEAHDDSRHMYADFLAMFGFRVEQASDGPEGLRKVQRRSTSVVVLALNLPKVDGWMLTGLMKSDPRLRTTAVVGLTGHATEEVEARARQVGCDGLLVKPCLPGDLLTEVRRHLSNGAR